MLNTVFSMRFKCTLVTSLALIVTISSTPLIAWSATKTIEGPDGTYETLSYQYISATNEQVIASCRDNDEFVDGECYIDEAPEIPVHSFDGPYPKRKVLPVQIETKKKVDQTKHEMICKAKAFPASRTIKLVAKAKCRTTAKAAPTKK